MKYCFSKDMNGDYISLFHISGNLQSHYYTHHKGTTMKCKECDFTTCSKKSLREHVKSHIVNTELQCPTCQYQCANKSSLRNHMKKHLSDKPFKCTFCSYESSQLGNLQVHVKRKHPNFAAQIIKVGERKSKLENRPILPKEKEPKDLPVKDKMKSKCVKSYKCDKCPAAFVREDSLKCHLKQHSDSSLSTAYAVLRLQQPVINTSRSPPTGKPVPPKASQVVSDSEKSQFMVSKPSDKVVVHDSNVSEIPPQVQSHGTNPHGPSPVTSPVIPSQQVNLGISDILLAAGMSGLNSAGNSPTSSKELSASRLAHSTEPTTVMSPSPRPDSGTLVGATVCQSPNEISSVQVMQNISLPYIKLPNGQVLILTGQTSLNQSANTSGQAILTDGVHAATLTAELTSQLLVQQPEMSQSQVIQCAADSTTQNEATSIQSVTSQAPDGLHTQQGAIPIQIILPSDSQQALPLVSQLLSSVVNRTTDNTGNQTQLSIQASNQSTGPQTVQNFVLQIPAHVGSLKDPAGNVAESQSYVLQIPGNNFN